MIYNRKYYNLRSCKEYSDSHNNDRLIVSLENCSSNLILHYLDKGVFEYFHQLPHERNSTKRSTEICKISQLLKWKMLQISPQRIQLVIIISSLGLAKSNHINGKNGFISSSVFHWNLELWLIIHLNPWTPGSSKNTKTHVHGCCSIICRSSPPEVFLGKGNLKIYGKFSCIFSEHFFIRTPLEGCICMCVVDREWTFLY